ncbi:MAG: 3-deoxy-manno-octulosonate cytidylyltransferase [Candidatus Margulisbacteria bacterium]|nr:3-deoxy-manno-octulosonate cytidylyltransferase [Candidatus Margulisiibacteriota bacterium]
MSKGKKEKVIAIIPARYASTRFEGKPLALICGQPMIHYVYTSVAKCGVIDELYVATDDERIARVVEGFGGNVIMTSAKHPTGTDRIAEAASKIDADIIVNVQGDEPLVKAEMVEQAVRPILDDHNVYVTTLMSKINNAGDFVDNTIVKAVRDVNDDILFLSRAPIPYPKTRQDFVVYKQIGLYAFKKPFLMEFVKMQQTNLELIEGVEFLRILENGRKIRGVETNCSTISVDTISDLCEVEKYLKAKAKKRG